MDKSVQVDFPPNPKADQFRKISGFDELTKDIYTKLDSIQAVLGYLLEKTKDLPDQNKISAKVINAEAQELPQDA